MPSIASTIATSAKQGIEATAWREIDRYSKSTLEQLLDPGQFHQRKAASVVAVDEQGEIAPRARLIAATTEWQDVSLTRPNSLNQFVHATFSPVAPGLIFHGPDRSRRNPPHATPFSQ
jgi:hypothetical protein